MVKVSVIIPAYNAEMYVKDARIRVIHKKNTGYGNTMQEK